MPIITGNPINVTWTPGSVAHSFKAIYAPTGNAITGIPVDTSVGMWLFSWGTGDIYSFGGEMNLLNGSYTDLYEENMYGPNSSGVGFSPSKRIGTVSILPSIQYNGAGTFVTAASFDGTLSYYGAISNPGAIDDICGFPLSTNKFQFWFPTSAGVNTLGNFRTYLADSEPTFVFERLTPIVYEPTGTYDLFQEGANTISSTESRVTFELDYSLGGIETPKTDWNITDRFNYYDYNRIKNNVDVIDTLAGTFFPSLTFDSTGDNMPSYESGTFARYPYAGFNAFENNLDKVATALNMDIGTKQTFYAESRFPLWTELNRLESAIETLYNVLIDMT